MPNRPIDFKFTSDVVNLLNGLGKAELSVEDLEQAFVEASNSSTDLERKINRATRDAERDVDKLERAIRDLPKATDDAADQAEKDLGGMGESARETGGELGDSFMGSLGESLASGQADVQDIMGEVLGEAVQAAGGAGGPALAAVAGLTLALWGVMRAESERQKQEISDAFNLVDLITGEIDKVKQFEEGIADLGGGDLQTGLDEAHRISQRLGISMEDVGLLVSGKVNPQVDVLRGYLNDVYLNQKDGAGEARKLIEVNEENTKLAQRQSEWADYYQQGLNGALGEAIKIQDATGKIDANMDGIVDASDEDILKKADTNADGLLDSVELINAGLQDAYQAAKDLDALEFKAKRLDVGFTYSNDAPVRNTQGQYWNPYTGKWVTL